MAMKELTSQETVRIMERIDGACGVLPHANNLSRAYEGSLDITKMKPQERIEAAQEVLGYLGPFDDCELEDCLEI